MQEAGRTQETGSAQKVKESYPAHAFALTATTRRGLVLTAVNASAHHQGLDRGMSLADARALLPGLTSAPARVEEDCEKLQQLARWCGRYGPARNIDGGNSHADETQQNPAGIDHDIWIDITGVAALFARTTATRTTAIRTSATGSSAKNKPDKIQQNETEQQSHDERLLLADMRKRLCRFGLSPRIGLADSYGAAHALARFGNAIAIAAPGETREALRDLPVDGLRLDAQTILLLKRLGLRRIGQLYGLPRASLERRFSDGGRRAGSKSKKHLAARLTQAVILRLDQALGISAEPRIAMSDSAIFLARRGYPELLISSDVLINEITRLAANLCAGLDAAERGARQFRLSLYRADGSLAEVEIGTSSPCRETGHIMRLLQEKLGRVDAGFGIDLITLQALQTEIFSHQQRGFIANGTSDTDASGVHGALRQLVDRLSNRLGKTRLLSVGTRASHIPERAQTFAPPDFRRPAPITPFPTGRTAARPAFLLTPPEPITVITALPQGPPAQLCWRRMTRRIMHAEGPERIEPEWWRALHQPKEKEEQQKRHKPPVHERTRDYYRLDDDAGGRYWVFRAGPDEPAISDNAATGPPRWYMHGLFG